MKDRRLEEKPACSVNTSAVPVEISCPQCGADVEMWSDEKEITCTSCGCLVHNSEAKA
jgi:ribosomal protein S27AE